MRCDGLVFGILLERLRAAGVEVDAEIHEQEGI